jgi:hypothetical protein
MRPPCPADAFFWHAGEQLADATLTQVFDSGDQLEQLSKELLIDIWNNELVNLKNSTWDSRSDNKGERASVRVVCARVRLCVVTLRGPRLGDSVVAHGRAGDFYDKK